jgi:hypothetical protein
VSRSTSNEHDTGFEEVLKVEEEEEKQEEEVQEEVEEEKVEELKLVIVPLIALPPNVVCGAQFVEPNSRVLLLALASTLPAALTVRTKKEEENEQETKENNT